MGDGFGVASGFGREFGCFAFQQVEHVGALLAGGHEFKPFAGCKGFCVVVLRHVMVAEVRPSGSCSFPHDGRFKTVCISAVDVLDRCVFCPCGFPAASAVDS